MSRVALLFVAVMFLFPAAVFAKPIKVTAISGLDFGNGAPGDFSKTIVPGTSENAENGSFEITGDANRAYSIVLPSTPQTITTGRGANTDSISVTAFTSFPVSTGLLNAGGVQVVFVGAQRAALRMNQLAGDYTGSYIITVVY